MMEAHSCGRTLQIDADTHTIASIAGRVDETLGGQPGMGSVKLSPGGARARAASCPPLTDSWKAVE
jgi:hypothetical protein